MDEFTRAVFEAVYSSHRQRGLRVFFTGMLILKHILRGLLFSWPLYLLSAAGLVFPGEYGWLFMLLLIPALIVSFSILMMGLSEDYQGTVRGRILKPEQWRQIVMGRDTSS